MIELEQKIQSAVKSWREENYKGASPVTQGLLEWWFVEDHFLKSGERFEFDKKGVRALVFSLHFCIDRFKS